MGSKDYTLIEADLICLIFRSFIILDGDKSPATILAFPQVALFFGVTNTAGDIEFNQKASFVTAMWTKLGRHELSPAKMPGERQNRSPGK